MVFHELVQYLAASQCQMDSTKLQEARSSSQTLCRMLQSTVLGAG